MFLVDELELEMIGSGVDFEFEMEVDIERQNGNGSGLKRFWDNVFVQVILLGLSEESDDDVIEFFD